MEPGNRRDICAANTFLGVADAEFSKLGNPQIGTTCKRNDHPGKIVAIARVAANGLNGGPTLYPTCHRAIEYRPTTCFTISYILVQPKHPAAIAGIQPQVARPGDVAFTQEPFENRITNFHPYKTGIGTNLLLLTIISFLVGWSIPGRTSYTFILEHREKFGALKAIGAKGRELIYLILFMATFPALTVYGWGIGLVTLMISPARSRLPNYAATSTFTNLAPAFGRVLLIAGISSYVGVRKVLKIEPFDSFRGRPPARPGRIPNRRAGASGAQWIVGRGVAGGESFSPPANDAAAGNETPRIPPNITMFIKIKALHGYKLQSQDGEIGRVNEFYFDDRYWTIRYLVADTGTWLTGRQVLISPYALQEVVPNEHHLDVALTKKRIENSPALDTHKPVSQQFESDYYDYYSYPYYWSGSYVWGNYPSIERDRSKWGGVAKPSDTWDRHLRSTKEVTGYHVQALDGEIGHITDFVVDDATWTIRYLIVGTKNWWPGKQVLISPLWIERVSWAESKVVINLSREAIQESPEFTADALISRDFETNLYDHYNRKGYWIDELANA